MLLSHRLILHRADALGITIPDDPDKVTDAVFLRLIAISGGHERLVGAAHCFRLTSSCLDNIYRCYGLQYLNISYTEISDISPLKDLPMLRSLSLSGLKCKSFEDLKWITTLEILNLNFSSIANLESLSGLQLLRSLDVGHSQISSISEISTLTRLEELYVDSSTNLDASCISESAVAMEPFVCLKYLQIGNTGLTKGVRQIVQKLPNKDVSILTKPRRIIWFESIIKNDSVTVKNMIDSGQDVNMRAGPGELDLFTYYYTSKCKSSTVFFDCCNANESYRPNGAHIAIFFNSRECLKLLSKAQVTLRCAVWMGSMQKVEEDFEESTDDEDFLDTLEEEQEEENEGQEEGRVRRSDVRAEEKSTRGGEHSRQEHTSGDGTGDSKEENADGDEDAMDAYLRAEAERELKFEEEEKRKEQLADKRNYGQRQRSKDVLPPVFIKTFRRSSIAQIRSLSNASGSGDESGGVACRPTIRPDSNADIKLKKGVVTSLTGFVDAVYNAGVHRITERMTERRVTGWKQVCKGIMTELIEALQQRTLVTDLDKRRKRLAEEAAMEEATAAAKERPNTSGGKEETQPLDVDSGVDGMDTMDAELSSSRRPSVGMLDSRPASSSQVSLGFEKSQPLQVEPPTAPSSDSAAASNTGEEKEYGDGKNSGGDDAAGEKESEKDDREQDIPQEDEHRALSFLDEYAPSIEELTQYEVNLSKLIQKQSAVVSHEYDNEEERVELLGKKSFWMERNHQLVRERRAEEEREHSAHKKKYDPSSNQFFFNIGHPLSRRERIAMLKATVKDRRDNMTM